MDDVYARYREALRMGHHAAAEGKFADALGHYKAAASMAGERALPHVGIGGMHLRMGRAKDALAAYERALAIEPANLDALSGRAAALLAAGRRDEAARAQEQMAEARQLPAVPDRASATGLATPLSRADTLHAAGEAAVRHGKIEAAVDAWLAESAEHALANHLDAAVDASLSALALAPGSARIHLELARLYFRRGWTDKGVERLELLHRLLALEPDQEISDGVRQIAADNASADERLVALARRPV